MMVTKRDRSRGRSSLEFADGFTLVELLVVMTLLAMLLAISLPRYFGAEEAARIRAREQNLATLRDAIDKFRADQGRYPSDLRELNQRRYIRAIPVDPVSGSYSWNVLGSSTEPGVYDVSAPSSGATSAPSVPRLSSSHQ